MGLSNMSRTWNGAWIWRPSVKRQMSPTDSLQTEHPDDNTYLYVRKEVSFPSEVREAKIHCTSSTEYYFYLNGKFVGRGPSPCDDEWKYYDTYDVREYLKPGVNVFAFVCYHYGTPARNSYFPKSSPKAGFLLDSEIVAKNGRSVEFCSNESWRVLQSPCWLQHTPRISIVDGYQEIYDARREIGEWMEAGFNDSSWLRPKVIGRPPVNPWVTLVPREIPFLDRETVYPLSIISVEDYGGSFGGHRDFLSERGSALSVDATRPGSLPTVVFDFGREVVGYLRVEFKKAHSGTITFSYGEGLELRDVDRLIVREGQEEWSPYRRCAFRYVKLAFKAFSEAIEIKSISLERTGYPVKMLGSFECSDKSLNDIWSTARYTVSLCMQDHFEDCVWREKNLWHNDMEIQSLVSYMAFGDYAMAAKCFRQMARIQRADGGIPAFGPRRCDLVIPDYCAHYVIGLSDYFRYSGDKQLLKDCFPSVVKLLAWFETKRDGDGLLNWGNRAIGSLETWSFIDWADIDRRGEISALQFLYFKALKCAGEIAHILGEKELSREWISDASVIEEISKRLLWSKKRGLFVDCRTGKQRSSRTSWSTNVLAMYSGAVPQGEWEELLESLSKATEISPIKTAVMNCHLAEVLFDIGEDHKAIALVKAYWGAMLSRGATTFWEEFDPRSEDSWTPLVGVNFDPSSSQSHCHGWSAGPAHMLPRKILGVEPIDQGFKTIVVRPCSEGLSWAKGRIPTPRGNIDVQWDSKDRKNVSRFKIAIPDGIRGEVFIRLPANKRPKIRIQGKVFTLENHKKSALAPCGAMISGDEREFVFKLREAGSFEVFID